MKDAHPGVWDSSVSGHLDSGEGYLSAARREMVEEMGIEELVDPAATDEVRAHELTEIVLGALAQGREGNGPGEWNAPASGR